MRVVCFTYFFMRRRLALVCVIALLLASASTLPLWAMQARGDGDVPAQPETISTTLTIFMPLVSTSAPPVIPRIDESMKARLRAILQNGAALGNRPTAFAKVGDSITEWAPFLQDIGCGAETLDAYAALSPSIDYFRSVTFPLSYGGSWCARSNSFTRASVTAVSGWWSETALSPTALNSADPLVASNCVPTYNIPLLCELRIIRPAVALIMFGTNDLYGNDPPRFHSSLTRVVTETLLIGVIPVLSTIPPRLDNSEYNARAGQYNWVIMTVAREQQIPLWNYRLALQGAEMVNQGMASDGIHPNVFNGNDPANFTSEALRYGYNKRNLTAVQILAKLKQIVIDDGAPDPSTMLSR